MQRVIGFLMIFAGCAGIGMWYGNRYREQVQVLRDFCYILEILAGEIRYGRCVLAQCCLQVAKRTQEPFRQSFMQVYERMLQNGGESFEEICEGGLKEGLKDIAAKAEDKEIFIQCFSKAGFQEDILQLRMIEQGKRQLEDRLCVMEGEAASKYKLALGMGVMSGLLLIILLL